MPIIEIKSSDARKNFRDLLDSVMRGDSDVIDLELTLADLAAMLNLSTVQVSLLLKEARKTTGKPLLTKGYYFDQGVRPTHKDQIIALYESGADEADIAYTITGEGDIPLIWTLGYVSHLDVNWAFPLFRRFATLAVLLLASGMFQRTEPATLIVDDDGGDTYETDLQSALARAAAFVDPEREVASADDALAAARALIKYSDLEPEELVKEAMHIAADICIYTNHNLTLEELDAET